MSLFLGKIHYWLFNKILWFESLEEEIIQLAKSEDLNIEKLSIEINLKYGEKLPNENLEDMIDTNNIHGWLQSKIHSAEGRMAAWTKVILENDENSLEKLENVYISQGIKAAKEVKESKTITNAKEIYYSINDYILDGMPCDRVNEVIISEDERVEWKRRICVHQDIWCKENIDVSIFYKLRNLWIKGFVNEVNSDYQFIEMEDKTMVIKKK